MTDLNSFVKQLRTEIVFEADTAQAVDKIDALNKRFEDTVKKADKAKQTFSELTEASTRLAAAGGLIFAPAILSAQKYVDAMGRSDAVSRKFIAAQERQTKAQQDLGRKAAAALTPYYEALADITELISRLPQGVVDAGIAIGGGLVLVGAVGILAGQIGVFVATATKLVASLNANAAIAGLGGAGNIARYAGVGALAIGTGTFLGVQGARAIGRSTDNQRLEDYGLEDAAQTLKELLGAAFGTIIGALGNAAKALVQLNGIYEALKLKVETTTDGVIGAFKDMIRAIEEVLLDTELFGKNLGEELGLQRPSLLSAVIGNATGQNEPERTPEQRAADIAANTEASLNSIDQWMQSATDSVLNFFNHVEDEASDLGGSFDTDALDAFEAFREDSRAIEADAFEQRRQLIADFGEESAKLEADYQRQRQTQLEDFQRQQAEAERAYQQKLADLDRNYRTASTEAEREYHADRQEAIDGFAQEELKRREDFEIKRRRAEEQAQRDLFNAAAKLDAQSVLRILQDRNAGRSTDSEDFSRESQQRQQQQRERLEALDRAYGEEKRKRAEQYRDTRQQAERQFRDQQRQQAENFKRQQQQQADSYRRLQSERRSAHQRELSDLQTQTSRLLQQRRRSFENELDQLMGWNNYEQSARAAHYRALQAQLNSFIGNRTQQGDTTRNSGGTRQRPQFQRYDRGGYTRDEIAQLHDREFVLDRSTTAALERVGGRSLTQQSIMNMANNSRSVGDIHLNINGAGDPRGVAREVRKELLSVFREMATT